MVSQRQTLYRSGVQYRDAETESKDMTKTDQTIMRCANNIKIGDVLTMKVHHEYRGRVVFGSNGGHYLDVTVLAYTQHRRTKQGVYDHIMLCGSNTENTCMWYIDNTSPRTYTLSKQLANFSDYRYGYWFSASMLASYMHSK